MKSARFKERIRGSMRCTIGFMIVLTVNQQLAAQNNPPAAQGIHGAIATGSHQYVGAVSCRVEPVLFWQ